MSDREIDIKVSPTPDKTLTQALERAVNLQPSEAEKAEFKARVARVFERGMIVDRLYVDLPPEWHGQWSSTDPSEIARLELLGFQIDTEFAPKRKLNDKADGSAIVGDVVHMIQPKWMHEILEEKRKQIYFETHLKKRQKEESDFVANQAAIGEAANTKVDSQADNIPGHEITQRLATSGA
jgi:hypothetical protein